MNDIKMQIFYGNDITSAVVFQHRDSYTLQIQLSNGISIRLESDTATVCKAGEFTAQLELNEGAIVGLDG